MSEGIERPAVYICAVYKSESIQDTYLFVDRSEGFERVPQELMEKFLNPVLVTQFKLFSERKLARADAKKVMDSLEEQGYYLQMPPQQDEQLQVISDQNQLLSR